MLTTSRRQISYPNPDRSDRADIALHISYVALAADVDCLFNQGTDAARQAATHQPGGGRFWYATDTQLLWYDDGANWKSVTPTTSTAGGLATRPAANAVTAGSTFFASDQVVQYISDGAAWYRVGVPAGATMDWFKPDAAVPAGWVLYDGGNLPSTTGIYADLATHLGSATKPDTRGRSTVGLGTHGDVSGMGVNDGLAVGQRTPRHNSTQAFTLPDHVHGHNLSLPDHQHGNTFQLPNHVHGSNFSLPDHTHNHALTLPQHDHSIAVGQESAQHKHSLNAFDQGIAAGNGIPSGSMAIVTTGLNPTGSTTQMGFETFGHAHSANTQTMFVFPGITGAIGSPPNLPGVNGSVGNPTTNPNLLGSVGGVTATPGINGSVQGIASTPAIPGSVGPGGSRPVDTGAYIVCAKIAKL